MKRNSLEKLSLQGIQQISLDIMKDIHSFCVANNIKYSLAYGTLLGAVRHKGFIPWDDDADIMMPRPDFERFLKIYKSAKFLLASPYDKDVLIPFARVFDVEMSYVETKNPWYKRHKTGVWVDIFPIDGVLSDSKKEAERRAVILEEELELLKYRSSLQYPFRVEYDWRYKLKVFFNKRYSLINYKKAMNAIKKLSMIAEYDDHEYCSDYSVLLDSDFMISKSSFDKLISAPFMDTYLMIPETFADVLTKCYGDYMTPPPAEERVPRQWYVDFYRK